MSKKKGIEEGIKRYFVLVIAGIFIAFFLTVNYDPYFRAGAIYILLGFGAMAVFLVVKEIFKK